VSFSFINTVFPQPALPTSITGCLWSMRRSTKNRVLIDSGVWTKALYGKRYSGMKTSTAGQWTLLYLQGHVRIQFKFRDDMSPWQEFLGFRVDVIIEHSALGRIFNGFEFGHPPFGKFNFVIDHLSNKNKNNSFIHCHSLQVVFIWTAGTKKNYKLKTIVKKTISARALTYAQSMLNYAKFSGWESLQYPEFCHKYNVVDRIPLFIHSLTLNI